MVKVKDALSPLGKEEISYFGGGAVFFFVTYILDKHNDERVMIAVCCRCCKRSSVLCFAIL